ncbi:MAG: hypothetical protein NHB32_12435 [Fischerella sp. CENA71]|nr:hypothetical protein [Fischerella sp. CENA71]
MYFSKNRQSIDKTHRITIRALNLVGAITIAFYAGFCACDSTTWNKIHHNPVQIQAQPIAKVPSPNLKITEFEYQAIASLLVTLLIEIMNATKAHRLQIPFEVDDDDVYRRLISLRIPSTNTTLIMNLQGEGSTFLSDLYMSIEPSKRIIHFEQLLQHRNQSFACGFRMLLNELQHPNLDWIKVNHDGSWYVPKQAYFPFINWIKEEIIRQWELEADIFDKWC